MNNILKNDGAMLVDELYRKVLAGKSQMSGSIEKLAGGYLSRYPNDREKAIEKFVQNQRLKCSASGFVSGMGGSATALVMLPADLAYSLYTELRVIAGIAYIRGYDLMDDVVKTAVFLCMVGNSVGRLVRQAGINIVKRASLNVLKSKLTTGAIRKINQAIGFRLVTKAGSKSIISLTKMLPVVGGAFGATFNWCEVNLYAQMAKRMFV